MGKKIRVLIALAVLSSHANAQLGEILGVIAGSISAGKARQEREQAVEQQHQAFVERQQKEAEEREAAAAARIQKMEEREDALLDGRIEPVTADDLQTIYGAGDGWDIAARPLLRPNRNFYVLSGKVLRMESDAVLLCETLAGRNQFIGNYFTVRLSKKTKKSSDILDRMRVNGPVAVVGIYSKNQQYQTVAAGVKVMPVFDAVHIIIPNYVDSGSQ